MQNKLRCFPAEDGLFAGGTPAVVAEVGRIADHPVAGMLNAMDFCGRHCPAPGLPREGPPETPHLRTKQPHGMEFYIWKWG